MENMIELSEEIKAGTTDDVPFSFMGMEAFIAKKADPADEAAGRKMRQSDLPERPYLRIKKRYLFRQVLCYNPFIRRSCRTKRRLLPEILEAE